MSFQYDATGIDPNASPDLMTPGWYPFRIYEAEETIAKKSGYPMVIAKCQVIGDSRYPDTTIWHYVVFIPKGKDGDGINVHFRKSIGVPWEGNAAVDADQWIGKKFMGKVAHKTFKGDDGEERTSNKIVSVAPMRADVEQSTKDSEIPF